jgi:hypothetical protein
LTTVPVPTLTPRRFVNVEEMAAGYRTGIVDQNIDVAIALGQRDHLVTIGNVCCVDFHSAAYIGASLPRTILEIGGCTGEDDVAAFLYQSAGDF